jgi:putative phosphoesterase
MMRNTNGFTSAPTSSAHLELELASGKASIVVVADTHSRPHPNSHAQIAAERPDYIVHAGDIGDPSVLSELEKIAPVLAVRGNIDAPMEDVPEALTVALEIPNRAATRVLVVHIGVNGPKLRGDVAALARKERAALVICGHSHVPFIGTDKGLAVFNPGSMGPRRFQLPIVFGVMNIDTTGVRLRHVDCETGQTWMP